MKQKGNHYYISLDLFRGFCGYGVAITHLNAFVFKNLYMEYLSFLFAELFFVLSGFVLYPQLLKVINNNKNLIIFYKRRWMRTLPLFIVVLILISALTNNLPSLDFFKYFFLVQKIMPNFIANDYYPVIWHLSIEEFFYLMFPLIVIFFGKEKFIHKVLYLFIFLILFKFVFSFFVDANFYRTGTLLRFDAILLGFIAAHHKELLIRNKKIVLLMFIIFTPIYLFNYNFFIAGNENPYIKFLFILLMQLTSTVVMFAFIFTEPFLLKEKIRKFSLLVSQQAYSIYLFHMILIYLFNILNFSSLFTSVIYIIMLFFVSTLIYKFFEEPIMKLRPKIL